MHHSNQIHCLIVVNAHLDSAERSALVIAAYELARTKKRRSRILDEAIKGKLSTDYKRSKIPGLAGVIFRAEFETGNGEGLAEFVVTDKLLESPEDEFFTSEFVHSDI